MLIGLDFDNTIACYNDVFSSEAKIKGLVNKDWEGSKQDLKLLLDSQEDGQTSWQTMQGKVYGPSMQKATLFPGVARFLLRCKLKGHTVFIVSHKTKHPFMGPKYDLHKAARGWISDTLMDGNSNLVDSENIFFELTKEEKIARIADICCDYFIDDLPEILSMPGFPKNLKRILFDPEGIHNTDQLYAKLVSWQEIKTFFETAK